MNKQLLGAGFLMLSLGVQAAVVDFDDPALALAPDSYYDPQAATVWSSGDANFEHEWNFGCCWGNFTYSNRIDTTTAGFANDRSAITGDGVGSGQDNYAVGYTGDGAATLSFDSRQTVRGAYFTNTTYAYLAMANGDDGNNPAFVKGPFGEGDFFELTVTGLGANGQTLGSLSFMLADGANVINDWTWFDLTGLGEVYGLSFSLNSSDIGSFGMNTPAYFAMDSMSIVPLPAAVWMFISGLGALGLCCRRKALEVAESQ
jgi:hypothetical protein